MSDDNFLRALLNEPDDDTVRLVYADWLEERDDPRGEFIRLQCALARTAGDDPGLVALRERERELLAGNARRWCAEVGLEPGQCEFRRGFVEAVEIHADRFLERPETLFARAPVRRVHFLHATRRIGDLADCPWLSKLDTLDLSANALRDAGAAVLAASPHLTGLSALDLSGCEINRAGAESLAAAGLRGLRVLRMAGCQIGVDGLRALLRAPGLGRVTTLDVRGNHQCWVSPTPDEPWITLTEANVQDEGVRLLAESPEAARLESVDLSLNLVGADGWEALLDSPHLSGLQSLNAFESNHVYTVEGPPDPNGGGATRTINEEISDVLCVSIPGYSSRSLTRSPGDPRWTQPPCTIAADTAVRLLNRFGHRVRFAPPSVRYGALFSGTREDWYGYRAKLRADPDSAPAPLA